MGGRRRPTVPCRYTESQEHRRAVPRRNTDALVGEQVMQGRRDEDTLDLPLITVLVQV